MKKRKIRYAVVGQGHIAQVAVLPGFKTAKNSELTALVSGDPAKLRALAKRYGVKNTYSYEQYDECLKSGEIDAVFIALPNHLHREYSVRAAEAGIHVLCEKPLAVSAKDSEAIAQATEKNRVKLMVAYRLHFDPTNLKAIELVHSGKIGKPSYFTSEFGYELKLDNIRMQPQEGGGPLHDIGIYCINAARYLFKSDPSEVFAFASTPDPKYEKIHETVSAVMKFPEGQIASFTCSFGTGAISNYRVVGTKGNLFIEDAYEYVGEMKHRLTVKEKSKVWTSKPGDQFAAEIQYFSDCLISGKNPAPSAAEGIADVRIIEALYRSIESGKPVKIEKLASASSRTAKAKRVLKRPTLRQAVKRPSHREPKLVKVEAAPK